MLQILVLIACGLMGLKGQPPLTLLYPASVLAVICAVLAWIGARPGDPPQVTVIVFLVMFAQQLLFAAVAYAIGLLVFRLRRRRRAQ